MTKPILKYFSVLLISLTLSACGGSSRSTVVEPPQAENHAPTANAGEDQAVNEKSLVTLSGNGTDIDGSITNYNWTQITGDSVSLSATNTATVSFTAPDVNADQILTFNLTVTDNSGATASDEINVKVLYVNDLPLVDAGQAQTVDELSQVTLTGTASDIDGSIVSYQWSQSSGKTVIISHAGTSQMTFIAPDVAVSQTLEFMLTVSDDKGGTASDSVSVQVKRNELISSIIFTDNRLKDCVDVNAASNGWTNIEQMISLYCSSREINNINGIEQLTDLVTVQFDYNYVFDISPVAQLTSLRRINFDSNTYSGPSGKGEGLSDISVLANLPNLTDLNIAGNQIVDLSPISSLVSLKNLDISYNNIVDLSPLTNMTAMLDLNLKFNPLDSIAVLTNMRALTKLQIYSTSPIDITVIGELIKLTELSIENTGVTDIDMLSGLTALTKMTLIFTQVKDISVLSNFTSLTELNLYNNKITSVNALSPLDKLETLLILSNDITSFDGLGTLPALTKMDARFNKATDLTSLASMTSIKELDLGNNNISDISPLGNLTTLEKLAFSNNDVSDVTPLYSLTNAKVISFYGNDKLTCDDRDALRAALPNASINGPVSCH